MSNDEQLRLLLFNANRREREKKEKNSITKEERKKEEKNGLNKKEDDKKSSSEEESEFESPSIVPGDTDIQMVDNTSSESTSTTNEGEVGDKC